MREIFWIEKIIILITVAIMFVFCFWQEYDEKKRDLKRAGHNDIPISLETSILIWGLFFSTVALLFL